MYEVHGWFVIWHSGFDSKTEDQGRVNRMVRSYLQERPALHDYTDLRLRKGEHFLTIEANPNHASDLRGEIDRLIAFLAAEAPGSYGLLYWRDDEDDSPPGGLNFRVIVLARGVISRRFDPFLSPAIPVIEASAEDAATS